MPYLLKLTKPDKELTRLAATAVEALVLVEVYVANGYSSAATLDTGDNTEISMDELIARAGQESA